MWFALNWFKKETKRLTAENSSLNDKIGTLNRKIKILENINLHPDHTKSFQSIIKEVEDENTNLKEENLSIKMENKDLKNQN